MRHLTKSLATLALLACAAPLTCLAASSAASSVSDSLTQSSGSISDSLKGSSHSSSPDNKQAQGDYKVIDDGRTWPTSPAIVELHLQPVAANTDRRRDLPDACRAWPPTRATSAPARSSPRCSVRTASSSPPTSRAPRSSSRSPTTSSAT